MNIKILKSGIMKGLKWIFFLAMVILAFRVGLIHSLKEPISPSSPKSPVLERAKDNKKVEESKEKKKDLLYSYRVRIILNGGTEIEGRIKLKGKSLMLKREKDGLRYRKELDYGLIKWIRLKEWRGYGLRVSGYGKKGVKKKKGGGKAGDGKDGGGIPYLFYPLIYEIRTLEEGVMSYRGRLRELEVIDLRNGYGSTRVYGIFYDYWVRGGLKLEGGYWASTGSKYYKDNELNPNALAISIIYFLTS